MEGGSEGRKEVKNDLKVGIGGREGGGDRGRKERGVKGEEMEKWREKIRKEVENGLFILSYFSPLFVGE